MMPHSCDTLIVLTDRLQRLQTRVLSRSKCLMYAVSLPAPSPPAIAPTVPVEFRIDCPHCLEIMESNPKRYGMDPRHIRDIPMQVAAGEVCVSGWVKSELVYYGWLQFQKRKLARLTSVRLARTQAAIYRCFTREDFRGKKVYPAALQFTFQWLVGRGYKRAIIDHHFQNAASQRGIERAGMQLVGDYYVYRFLCLKWATFDNDLRMEISDGGNHE